MDESSDNNIKNFANSIPKTECSFFVGGGKDGCKKEGGKRDGCKKDGGKKDRKSKKTTDSCAKFVCKDIKPKRWLGWESSSSDGSLKTNQLSMQVSQWNDDGKENSLSKINIGNASTLNWPTRKRHISESGSTEILKQKIKKENSPKTNGGLFGNTYVKITEGVKTEAVNPEIVKTENVTNSNPNNKKCDPKEIPSLIAQSASSVSGNSTIVLQPETSKRSAAKSVLRKCRKRGARRSKSKCPRKLRKQSVKSIRKGRKKKVQYLKSHSKLLRKGSRKYTLKRVKTVRIKNKRINVKKKKFHKYFAKKKINNKVLSKKQKYTKLLRKRGRHFKTIPKKKKYTSSSGNKKFILSKKKKSSKFLSRKKCRQKRLLNKIRARSQSKSKKYLHKKRKAGGKKQKINLQRNKADLKNNNLENIKSYEKLNNKNQSKSFFGFPFNLISRISLAPENHENQIQGFPASGLTSSCSCMSINTIS